MGFKLIDIIGKIMLTDNTLITFNAISNFTTCLCEVFGPTNRSLKLYTHLISKTTLSHDLPIKKHIAAFKEFCVANREGITTKNASLLHENITYSVRVYIDIAGILKRADRETTDVIWKHLLTISALTDPSGNAREILKDSVKKSGGTTTESDFLSNIIGKVEQHVDPDANPMEAVAAIMKSGIFTELVGGMGNGLQDGTLDLSKLMGTVQKMVSSLGTSTDDMDTSNPMNMMSSMMSSLSTGSNASSGGDMPDISSIMGMMGPMLGALSQPSGGSVEDKIDAQLQAAKKTGELSSITEIE